MDEATYAGMPATLTMREVRAGGWTLVTSLVDAKSVSKIELVDLYHSRWQVELDFRSIKDVMQVDELRCKTGGYRTLRMAELSLYHVLGRLREPRLAHKFF